MKTVNEELKIVVKLLDEKLASNIVVIDVGNVNPLCQYFVICTGNNERHLKGLSNSLVECAVENNIELKRVEGSGADSWTLVDLVDIVVHIFSEEGRDNYSLEKLWGDLEYIDVEQLINS